MASYKIQKANGAAPADETELAVAQALVDLETSIPELRPLVISSAKEVMRSLTEIYIELNN
jgi:small subunit ribosomal protein S7e